MSIEQVIQLGLGGIALFFMYKVLMKVLESNEKLSASIDKNTAATNELYTYVKVRNGTLERLVMEDSGVRDAAKKAIRKA